MVSDEHSSMKVVTIDFLVGMVNLDELERIPTYEHALLRVNVWE